MAAWPEGRSRWEMARELAVTDFRLKYYDSALGYAWSMLSPLLMLAIYRVGFQIQVPVLDHAKLNTIASQKGGVGDMLEAVAMLSASQLRDVTASQFRPQSSATHRSETRIGGRQPGTGGAAMIAGDAGLRMRAAASRRRTGCCLRRDGGVFGKHKVAGRSATPLKYAALGWSDFRLLAAMAPDGPPLTPTRRTCARGHVDEPIC